MKTNVMGTTDERKMEGLLALSDGKNNLYVELKLHRRKEWCNNNVYSYVRSGILIRDNFTLKYELVLFLRSYRLGPNH